jgi:hypothetical protein
MMVVLYASIGPSERTPRSRVRLLRGLARTRAVFDGPNLLRDGAMETVSGGTRAPSTPGSLRGKSLLLRGLNRCCR